MQDSFVLSPGQLHLSLLKQDLVVHRQCLISPAAFENITRSQALVASILEKDKPVYGINTGFGALANQRISTENMSLLQKNLVLSHACGTGEYLPDTTVAMMLLLKINALSQGYSGVSLSLIQALCALYNKQVYPCVPMKGSVGASGDLAPLAHLVLPLLGEGHVRYQGECLSAKEGLRIAGLDLVELAPKEGLALLNGLQASAAVCIEAFFKTERLFEAAILAGSLSVDAAAGSDTPFDDRIHAVRGHKAQRTVAEMYRSVLHGSAIRAEHRDCAKVQDPYALRCQPQIMGAVLHQMKCVEDILNIEVNGVTDNPLIFIEEGDVLSGGNFHGQMLAFAADNLALAIAEIGSNAERRIALLVDPHFSGLPAFLIKESGLNSGFMIAHVTAAACVSDNKARAHPHSVDSIPTSANQEDHVSMAMNAALRLHDMIDNTATVLAIELLAASQGLDLRAPLTTSPILQKIHQSVRAHVPTYDKDRYFAPDIAIIKQKILHGDFSMPHK